VHKTETDISLIRKYLNGELDAKAMHQLERRAQDDPFLMDALEGYEMVGSDQQTHVDELSARLNQRVNRKERRIIPYRTLGIAASVLIVCSVGVLWLKNGHKEDQSKVAVNAIVKPAEKTIGRDTLTAAPPGGPVVTQLRKEPAPPANQKMVTVTMAEAVAPVIPPSANTIANVNIKDSVAKDTTPLNEAIVMEYSAQKKKTETKKVVTGATMGAVDKPLQARVAGVEVNNTNVPKQTDEVDFQNKMPALSLNRILITNKAGQSPEKIITGRVVAKDDGSPIAGASVNVPGTSKNAVTDSNGLFTLSVDNKSKTKLNIGYMGYQGLQVNVGKKDTINTTVLAPNNYASKKIIRGKVIGKDDGLPIVGASVKLAGTNVGAVTDATGRFSLPADSGKSKLVIASLGYQAQQINIHNRDSLQTIALQPSSSSLSEVVVTGYSSKSNEEAPVVDAHPQAGWSSYKKYLKENAISPDGKTGVVKLSFEVDINGIISNIKVVSSLSKAADQKAIDLINNGPDWAGRSNGQTETVTVRVKFVK
jgi:TonB family protein